MACRLVARVRSLGTVWICLLTAGSVRSKVEMKGSYQGKTERRLQRGHVGAEEGGEGQNRWGRVLVRNLETTAGVASFGYCRHCRHRGQDGRRTSAARPHVRAAT